MEATAPVPVIELNGITDGNGTPLSTGDRVKVTGSDRFGEGEGVVIGAVRIEDFRLVPDGELVQVNDKPIRIRVRLDNGTEGEDYTASQGRVEKLDVENQPTQDDIA